MGMTALLTADEASRLVPGERLVIVRPGEPLIHLCSHPLVNGLCSVNPYGPPQGWISLTGPCPICNGAAACPGDMVCGSFDCRDGRRIVPLYTECPTCDGSGEWCSWESHPEGHQLSGRHCPRCNATDQVWCVDGHAHIECRACGFGVEVGPRPCPDCRGCEYCGGTGQLGPSIYDLTRSVPCLQCQPGRVLAGRGSIEVVPVVDGDNVTDFDCGWVTVYDDGEVELWVPVKDIPEVSHTTVELTLDPLPVPGRDWGIVIDCAELA